MGMQGYLVLGSLVAVLGYLLHKFFSKINNYWPSRGVYPLKMGNFISRVFVKQQTFLELDEVLYKQLPSTPYGGYMEMNKPVLFVKDMEIIKQIYVKDFDHFVNRRSFNAVDKHWNHMLFNKSDQEWKDLRSTMSPTFTTGKIRRMFPILRESSKRLTNYLSEVIVKNNGLVDLEEELGKYAMDVISSAAFGIESGIFQDPNSTVTRMSKKLQLKFSPLVMIRFFLSMMSPMLAKIFQFRVIDHEADAFFTKLLKESIQYREKSGEKRDDFLQLMIETKNGQSEKEKEVEEMDAYEKDAQLSQDKRKKTDIDDDIIIANCILFIFGGFDTTQSALLFAAYALALNTDVQEKLRRELEEAAEQNDGELTYDKINQCEYLDKVINETLRMYPPAVRTERKCTKDFAIPDTKIVIPQGAIIGIPVYQLHHDPNHFPNPQVFDPERFSPEEKSKRHPYAYMPFGHGPRNCIANRFALTQTKTAIANLVLNFDIEPCKKTTIPMEYDKKGSLKPVHGMWLKLNPKN